VRSMGTEYTKFDIGTRGVRLTRSTVNGCPVNGCPVNGSPVNEFRGHPVNEFRREVLVNRSVVPDSSFVIHNTECFTDLGKLNIPMVVRF
jgi:hypothetical protein